MLYSTWVITGPSVYIRCMLNHIYVNCHNIDMVPLDKFVSVPNTTWTKYRCTNVMSQCISNFNSTVFNLRMIPSRRTRRSNEAGLCPYLARLPLHAIASSRGCLLTSSISISYISLILTSIDQFRALSTNCLALNSCTICVIFITFRSWEPSRDSETFAVLLRQLLYWLDFFSISTCKTVGIYRNTFAIEFLKWYGNRERHSHRVP